MVLLRFCICVDLISFIIVISRFIESRTHASGVNWEVLKEYLMLFIVKVPLIITHNTIWFMAKLDTLVTLAYGSVPVCVLLLINSLHKVMCDDGSRRALTGERSGFSKFIQSISLRDKYDFDSE